MKYPEFVKSRFKDAEQTAMDFAKVAAQAAATHHAVLGLVGEWFEYKFATDEVNRREELGDFGFYMQALAQQVGLELANVPVRFGPTARFSHMAAKESCEEIERALGEMLDLSKKQVIYLRQIDQAQFAKLLASIVEPLRVVLCYYGYTMGQLQVENVGKLTLRYPQAYSNEAANSRADKA